MTTGVVHHSIRAVHRIIAIPLTRPVLPTVPSPSSGSSHSAKSFTYYHFQIHAPPSKSLEPASSKSSWGIPREGLLTWVQSKASQTWAGFGKAKEGAWQLKVFKTGERIVDRIDFEELSLKSVDPSLGPKLFTWSDEKRDEQAQDPIPLLYPSTLQTAEASITHLQSLLATRSPRHKKGFWIWLIIAPMTAPFMIVPVIPNLPFFFCVWRSWSHYKAYKASEYLSKLIEVGAIVPQADVSLDEVYAKYQPKALPSPSESKSETPGSTSEQRLLLTRDAIPPLVASFGLNSSAESDMYRALEQVAQRTIRDSQKETL